MSDPADANLSLPIAERIARAIEQLDDGSYGYWCGARDAAKIARETSPWVAVEDGLPDTADDVYVLWANGCTSVAAYRYTTGRFGYRYWEDQHTSHDDSTVTHWSALPGPPLPKGGMES